jgi:sarcosine oxidase subunit gamma
VTADARRRTPLGPFADTLGRLLGAREAELAAQVSLRVADNVGKELGLPTTPNTWSTFDGHDALWLGPNESLVVSEIEAPDAIVHDLEPRLSGHHMSVVDVSAARAAIELTGPDRFDVLSAGCGLDLHPKSWRLGMCAQTLFARVGVLLQERDEATRVFLRPSYAGYLVTWLAHAARA